MADSERENQKYKECGSFNVALDYVSSEDGTFYWEVTIEWTDGTPSDIEEKYDTYEKALKSFERLCH